MDIFGCGRTGTRSTRIRGNLWPFFAVASLLRFEVLAHSVRYHDDEENEHGHEREEFANPYRPAEHLHIDDVIEPAETRKRLIEALEITIEKVEDTPDKKHGIIPA